ncbi:MAG TPA: SDR family oxidoreductase [Acidimicrobiia bacterium]|nr:SDR family oxidoreductase [Acidimicrobiia bacterium]
MIVGDDLTGKVAIVTGAGTGIGADAARLLTDAGADVVLGARKVERLEAVGEELRASGRRVLVVPTDVRDEEQCEALVARAVDELGRVDVVVNNAGGSYLFPHEDTPLEKWDNSFALNVRGPFVLTQAAGRHMLAQGSGVFVNISSAAGLHGVSGGVAYSAAKSALQMLTRVVAMEWGTRGIRANCIAVGAVASEGALRSWERAGILDELIGGAGEPIDIARAILYLASDASRFMNGQTIALMGNHI